MPYPRAGRKCIIVVSITLAFLLLSTKTASAALIFEDKFENGLANWVVSAAPCVINTQNSNPASPDGGKNLLLYRPADATIDCFAEATLSNPISKGKVSFYFYDNMAADNPMNLIASIKSSTNQRIWLGVRELLDEEYYTYQVDGVDYNSGVPRSIGWHNFAFYKFDNHIFGVIDGQVLKKVAYTNNFKDIANIKFSAGWGTHSAARFDGITVYDHIPAYTSPSVELLSETPIGNKLVLNFKTTIPSLTGNNYFNNVFFTMADADPQESDTDHTPMFGVIKVNGSWKFYGLRWTGNPPILANPIINALSSYRWDVGGFSPGSNNQICSNTTRKSTTTETADSFACLDVAGSTVNFDSTTSTLTINWKVNILNVAEYVQLRDNRRNFPDRSTKTRFYSPYLNVDHPLTDYQQVSYDQAQLRLRNTWTNYSGLYLHVYNHTLPDYRNSVTATPKFREENQSRIPITITHPTDATKISEVYFWADELDPSAERSDVAFPFLVKKVSGTWRFYGRRYLGPNQVCPDEPFDLKAEDCYLNYTYDVGGFTPGSNNHIYHHLNRTSGTTLGDDALVALNVAGSSVSQSGNTLTVTWDLNAFNRNGSRQMGLFSRWLDSTGINSQWNAAGRWNLNYPHAHYNQNIAIIPKADNSGYQFADGSPYLGLGLSHFFLYRTHHPAELNAYLAKMKIYGMDHLRVFVYPYNPLPESIASLLRTAHTHGIYVTLGTDRCDLLSVYDTSRSIGYAWAEWLSNEFGDYPAWFKWEACNDIYPPDHPTQLNWTKDMLTKFDELEPDKLHAVQPMTDEHLGLAFYSDLKNYVDDYSFRTFSSNSTTTVSDYIAHYNQAFAVSPRRPLYYGEGRVDPYFSYEVDQTQEASTLTVFNQSANKNISAVNFAILFYRPEYENNGQLKQPELSPAEWQAYLTHAKRFRDFPQGQQGQYQGGTAGDPLFDNPDPNGDGTTTSADYDYILDVFHQGSCGHQADLNSDCQVDMLDLNIVLTALSGGASNL